MNNNGKRKLGEIAGIINATEHNAVNNMIEEKFHGARGHGFAAERANDMYDNFYGEESKVVGDNNLKNGQDRVLNGINIQSKYCNSGSKCIQECFEGGEFRYYNFDGTPMQIEVPSDKYEDAVKAMQNRIDRGQINGVNDARDIVRKGHFTYEQAKNIAKFMTIESLAYDAYNGIVSARNSCGISFAISFFCAYRDSKDYDYALNSAIESGFRVGGVSFAGAVLSGQLTKAGFNTLLVNGSEKLVSLLGSKASEKLVNAFNSGTNVYGAAAMKSAAKMVRSNFVTGVATTIVLSAGDLTNIFRGRISGAQLFKNVVNTGAGVAGGVAGWTGGAAAGAEVGAALGSVVPGVGNAIGATVGGFVGGLAGSMLGGSVSEKVSQNIMDGLIDDDSKEMLKIIEEEFKAIAVDYLLGEDEANETVDNLKSFITADTIKDMYQSGDRHEFAYKLLERCVLPITENREKVYLPSDDEMLQGLRMFLENPSREAIYKPKKTSLTIGLLGHVNHGKTTLTSAITMVLSKTAGCNAKYIDYKDLDLATEEKDLGYSVNLSRVEYETINRHYYHLDYPSHAEMVKDMITGSAQMDGAILVVSAAEGPMPQTREHILLARQTGVTSFVVFLNKIDQVEDPELLELVELEIRELLSSYEFPGDDIPVIAGSALMALKGDPRMKEQIYKLMRAVDEYIPNPVRNTEKPFMMPIEEVFYIKGHGTVVTGHIERGELLLNDEVDIVGLSYNNMRTTVTAIEMSRELFDKAVAGDNIGCMLRPNHRLYRI